MSKLFRARQLDAGKPMPIYMSEEISDLEEYLAVNRAVPELPSGVLKEEEREHHLQRAIGTGLIIPTPDTETIDTETYNSLYPTNYKVPRQLIRVQPFDIEQEIPDYDLDSEDEAWINAHEKTLKITSRKFEEMMDCLENNGHSIITQYEAKLLLKEDDDLLIAIYDYWLNKRLKNQHPLIPRVKTEAHLLNNSYNHPYLAFRRRRKMLHTRKKQKNRESSYQKMIKIRRDLVRALKLLDLIKLRENAKKQLLQLTVNIFEKRYRAGDFNGQILSDVTPAPVKSLRPAFAPIYTNQLVQSVKENAPRKEKHQYKRRKYQSVGGTVSNADFTSINISTGDDDDNAQLRDLSMLSTSPTLEETPFTFHRSRFTSYHRPVTGILQQDLFKPKFRPISIKTPRRTISGTGRIGRGGRLILQNKLPAMSYDNFWEACDYTIHDSSPANLSCQTTNVDTIEPYRVEIQQRNSKESSEPSDSLCPLSLTSDAQVILQVEDLMRPDDIVPLQLNFGNLDLSKDTTENCSLDSESTTLLDLAVKDSTESNQEGNLPFCDINSFLDVKPFLKSDSLPREMQKDLSINNVDLETESLGDGLLYNSKCVITQSRRESSTPILNAFINSDYVGHSSFSCT